MHDPWEIPLGATNAIEVAAARACLPAARASFMKGLRVLLVEDDPLIRLSTEDQLTDCGCEVVAVRDGERALAALQAGAFDLLFSDARLPGMSGPELIGRSLAQWPGLRVVLASGYSDLSAALPPGVRVVTLPKPYSDDGIRRALADAMADGGA
jgi:CheY-like chemotaxis protein